MWRGEQLRGGEGSEHRFPLLFWKQRQQKVSFHAGGQRGGSPRSGYLQRSRSGADGRAAFAGTALSERSAGSGGAGAAPGLCRVSPRQRWQQQGLGDGQLLQLFPAWPAALGHVTAGRSWLGNAARSHGRNSGHRRNARSCVSV